MYPSTVRCPLYVDQITEMDVLLGRGTGPNDNRGNQIFRNLVISRREEYLACKTSEERQRVFKTTIALVYANGGRFLKKVGSHASKGGAEAPSPFLQQEKPIYQIVTDTKTLVYKCKQQYRYAKERKNAAAAGAVKNHRVPPQAKDETGAAPFATPTEADPSTMAASHVLQLSSLPSSLFPSTNGVHQPSLIAPSPAVQRQEEAKKPPATTAAASLQTPPGSASSLATNLDFLTRQQSKQVSQPKQPAGSSSRAAPFSLTANIEYLSRQQQKPHQLQQRPAASSSCGLAPFSLAANIEFLSRLQPQKQPASTATSSEQSTTSSEDLLRHWLMKAQQRNLSHLAHQRLVLPTSAAAAPTMTDKLPATQGLTQTPMPTTQASVPLSQAPPGRAQSVDDAVRSILSSLTATGHGGRGSVGASSPALLLQQAQALVGPPIQNQASGSVESLVLSRLLTTNQNAGPNTNALLKPNAPFVGGGFGSSSASVAALLDPRIHNLIKGGSNLDHEAATKRTAPLAASFVANCIESEEGPLHQKPSIPHV